MPIYCPWRIVWVVFFAFLGGCSTREEISYKLEHRYSVADPQFRRSMGNLLGPPLVSGNKVTSLQNGDRAFPAMLQAIREAKHHINLESFIYRQGSVGAQFTEVLSERARAGVKVHLIVDAIGSDAQIDPKFRTMLNKAGVRVEEYHPVAWYNPSKAACINNRTHRKILVIDGRKGFIGGMGIADEWLGHAQDEKHWRDMHYAVEGPAVQQLQSAFCDNWMKTTGEVLDGDDYFPDLPSSGGSDCQVFKSDASGGSESMQLMFLMSLAAAKKNIRIGNAYFVPDNLTVDNIVRAAQRGVHIQIIVPAPHRTDVKLVPPASRIKWGKLLQAGVEIYEYQPTMYHTKLLIVDEHWTSVGSTNIDARSFKLNDEANLNILDPTFAAEEVQNFDADLKQSKRYTLEDWNNRGFFKWMSEGFASLLSPLL